jgi:hypothetical protein
VGLDDKITNKAEEVAGKGKEKGQGRIQELTGEKL